MPAQRNSNPLRKTTTDASKLMRKPNQQLYGPMLSKSYPRGISRLSYRDKKGKALTPHMWAVYDFVCSIPHGRVCTYKDVCVAIGQGSPRSVGSALRRNPFAPVVPCHRVIASNLFLGGYLGSWGIEDAGSANTECHGWKKIDLLRGEGVEFDSAGYLLQANAVLWRNV